MCTSTRSGRYRQCRVNNGRPVADIGPISASKIKPTLSRPCRHWADVEPLCKHAVGPISAMSGEHRPPFCRYRADVGSDIGPMSWPTSPDIGPTSDRCVCAVREVTLATCSKIEYLFCFDVITL